MRPLRRSEEASATVELVVLAPLLVAFLGFVVLLGRLAQAEGQLSDAVRAGAQAGVIASGPLQAAAAARAAVLGSLSGGEHRCNAARVEVDTSSFVPGGELVVAVSCSVSFAGLLAPGVPGSRTIHAQLSAPVEEYRGVGG